MKSTIATVTVTPLCVALVITAGSAGADRGEALQPMQPGSLSPGLVVDYLTVESHLQKPVRGPYYVQ